MTKADLLHLTYQINGAAIAVHKELGPGLLENIYHECLKHELGLRSLTFESEIIVPVIYKGLQMRTNLRCDLLIESIIPVELKAVESIHPHHEAQLITYMKLLQKPKGLLFNFNVDNLYNQGQRSYVNELFRNLE